MSLLPRKGLLAIAAVVDVALHARGRPVSAKVLAARHGLPPRHLEPVLQALVRDGVLKGVRGPRGGYELARERRRISVEDIIKAAESEEDETDIKLSGSVLLKSVILPAVAEAEQIFSGALARVNVEDLVRSAHTTGAAEESKEVDFTI
ncbi:MAG TPA: Rrf2 family transcriptional regulator [Xanthobacteraceae bacterium]|nr:Rrf2 family transcriptional regulator [Xanthobacteraceae bacterium]